MCFQIASHCRDLAKCQWAMKCIQDLRAFMFPTAKVTETEQATISSASISRDALAPLLMVEWQDDFDPLCTKNNRGSVMVQYVTASGPSGSEHQNYFRNTQVLNCYYCRTMD